MFECTACIRRSIRTLLADLFDARPNPRLSHRLHPLRSQLCQHRIWTSRRAYATDLSQAHQSQTEDLPTNLLLGASSSQYHRQPSKSNRNDRQLARELDTEPTHDYRATDLQKELYWVRDPLKLANKVLSILKRDDAEDYNKALALVRLASKNMTCTVSWNHLVDYNMSKGRVKRAIFTYNEMKKRAQIPDAHTFTTLFRGFSWNVSFPQTLEKTLSIYHSMFSDNSPVKPSITHTNAVLKVCALAKDSDAMFGVAARLPTKGRGAPDKLTFTTILNAIRAQVIADTKGQAFNDAMRERQSRAVLQGRRMWEEIRDRWAKGDLMMDEELVCAMGRLLLIGHTDQDNDDILSLLQQTMQIPRQIPPLGHPARTGDFKHATAPDKSEQKGNMSKTDLSVLLPPSSSYKPEDADNNDIETTNPFAPLSRFLPDQYHIHPGVNTLSLALEACTAMGLTRAAQDYWGLLTSPENYNIVPDRQNYHVYLRLLRLQRASKLAVEIVEEMKNGVLVVTPPAKLNRNGEEGSPAGGLQMKTFRIALSCCYRDKNNRNALSHAQRLVRIMNDTLEAPDPRCLTTLLDVALAHQPRNWRVLMDVARGTADNIRNLRSLLTYKYASSPHDKLKKEKVGIMEEEIGQLARRCVGVFDILISTGREGMSGTERRGCMKQRSVLAAWLTRRANLKRERREENRGQGGRIWEAKAIEQRDGTSDEIKIEGGEEVGMTAEGLPEW